MNCRHVITDSLHAATNVCLSIYSSEENDVKSDCWSPTTVVAARRVARTLSGVSLWAVITLQTLRWRIGVESRACNKISLTLNATRSTAFHAVLSRAALWWITAIYWPDFPTFTYHSPIWRPQWGGSPRDIGFIFGMGKLEWLDYNLVKVTWWSIQLFGHSTSTWQDTQTDTQTFTSPQQQPP